MRKPIVALVAALVVLASCTTDDKEPAKPTPDKRSKVKGVTTYQLKPQAKGLMTRGGLPPSSVPSIDHGVIHLLWKDLETADQTFSGTGWSQVAAAKERGIKVRLRIMAGIHAPKFVKQLHPPDKPAFISDVPKGIDCAPSGGIAVYNPVDKTGNCVPYFWYTPVLDQYQQLMQEVARRYDIAPEGSHVLEVVNSACMTVYAEPFFRAHGDIASNQRLFSAGLDYTNDRLCHERAVNIHNSSFNTTRTSLAVNAWDVIDGSADDGRAQSWPRTQEFGDWARATMGEKLVIQNNGLGEDEGCPTRTGTKVGGPQYCYIASIGQPKGFQSETFPKLGGAESCAKGKEGLFAALGNASAMKASFVELPGIPSNCGGLTGLDQTRLANVDKALEDAVPPPTTTTTGVVTTTTTSTVPVTTTPPTTAPPPTPTQPVCGTWALQQVSSTTDLARRKTTIDTSLAFANMRGFSMRVPWKSIDTDFAVLDEGKKIADAHRKAYSVRFMAGRHTPARIFDAGAHYYLLNGEKIPTPFAPDGTPGNPIFEAEWDKVVSKMAAWSRANNVKLLHVAWWGRLWAEIDNGEDTIQRAPGYTREAWLAGHKRLVDIAHKYSGPDLAIEFPLSGYWGGWNAAAADLIKHMMLRFGQWSPLLFVQANVLGVYNADPSGPHAVYHGMQMFDQNDYLWPDIFRELYAKKSVYVEIYVPSFALPNRAKLQTEITRFSTEGNCPAGT